VCDQKRAEVKSPAQLREELRALWLSALTEQYKEASETWKALETKAQGAITVAGIFLAAVFAFVREAGSIDLLPRVLLGVTALLLVASVAIALLSLEIRPVVPPPLGDFVDPGVTDLVKLPNDKLTEEVLATFMVERATKWKEANKSVATENATKARQVWWSQILLGSATVPVAVITITALI
jgi:hypothetical protein